MTPEQLRAAIADNSVNSTHNSYGNCTHGTSFAAHCDKCENVDIEQLLDELYGTPAARDSTIRRRAIRESEDKAVEDVCAKYRRHTVDIRGPAPQYIEDEMLALERVWRRIRLACWVLILLAGEVMVVRWLMGGGE